MGLFTRKTKKSKRPIEKQSIPELMDSVKWINPMNKSSILKALEKGDEKVWMNPNNQDCFNAGWFTLDDFRDWARGTGIIVKGDTQEAKDKVMHYAKSYYELDMSIFIYSEYLDELEPEILHGKSDSRYGTSKYFQDLSKEKDSVKVIKKLLGNHMREIKEKLDSKIRQERTRAKFIDSEPNIKDIISDINRESRDRVYFICHTLSVLGHGYFGACNTPENIENLSWAMDLPFAIAYRDWLIEDGYELPDFKFVKGLRFKS